MNRKTSKVLFIAVLCFCIWIPAFAGMTSSNSQYQKGFQQGNQDASEGLKNRYAYKKNDTRNRYEKGYFRGYRQAAHKTQQFDLLRDSPSKTPGSDFNGDGIHDFITSTDLADRGGTASTGVVYVFFGSSSVSGTKNLAGTASADVTFLGKNVTGEAFGLNAGSAGDVNGDGIDDIIVGALSNDDGASARGAAYIFFGSTAWSNTTIDIQTILSSTSSDVTFLGRTASDNLGDGVSSAGDVNGDGFDDVVIGASSGRGGGAGDSGEAFIFFGAGNLSGTKNLGTIASADFTLLGKTTGDYLGKANSVSGAGDFNGDGFDDVLMASRMNDVGGSNSGAVYVIFGSSTLSGTRNLAGVGSPDFTITGQAGEDRIGTSISGAGDINGDGFDDIIAGAYQHNADGSDRGAAYVYFGGTSVANLTKTLSTNSTADFSVTGKATDDQLGKAVSAAGDINDDGLDDIIVGADLNDFTASGAGVAYIIFGASNLSGWKDLARTSSADVTITGSSASDQLGFGVSAVGDINQDGIADVSTGAVGNDDCSGSLNRGTAYVIFGGVNISGNIAAANSNLLICGNTDSDNLGKNVGGGKGN